MPGFCPVPPFKNPNLDPSWAMALRWGARGGAFSSLAWKVGPGLRAVSPKFQALPFPQLPEGHPSGLGRRHEAGGDGSN